MYSVNVSNLQAFLIWNRLLHSFLSRSKNVFQATKYRWIATRERYDSMLESSMPPVHLPGSRIMNASIFGEILVVAILIFFVSSLIGPTANASTGITIPHAGFVVNPNITASPGLVPLTQLLPFLLVAVAFFGGLAIFEKHTGAF